MKIDKLVIKHRVPVIFLLSFLSGLVGYSLGIYSNSGSDLAVSNSLPVVSKTKEDAKLYFIRDGDIMVMNSDGEVRTVLSNPSEDIASFEIFGLNNELKILYMSVVSRQTDTHVYYEPSGINIFYSNTQSVEKLVDKVPKVKYADDYVGPTGLSPYYAISEDETKIAFAYDNNLYLYDLDSKIMDVIKADLLKGDSMCGSLSPKFWIDDNTILIRSGCYEGSQEVVLDLKSRSIVEEIGFSYISGKVALAGLGESRLLLKIYGDYFGNRKNNDRLLLKQLKLETETEVVAYPRIGEAVYDPDSDMIYYTASVKRSVESAGPWDIWGANIKNGNARQLTNDGVEVRTKEKLYFDKKNGILMYNENPTSGGEYKQAVDTKDSVLVLYNMETGKKSVFENAYTGRLVVH